RAVVAMGGGRTYDGNQFNRAVQAMRQPGSTFKLFVYYAALRKGMSPDDVILDAPVEVNGWEPENYSGRYYGRVTLAEAFGRSLNAATVRLSQQVGLDAVIAAARDLGLRAPLGKNASLPLGTSRGEPDRPHRRVRRGTGRRDAGRARGEAPASAPRTKRGCSQQARRARRSAASCSNIARR